MKRPEHVHHTQSSMNDSEQNEMHKQFLCSTEVGEVQGTKSLQLS